MAAEMRKPEVSKKMTKKQLALEMSAQGVGVQTIAQVLRTDPAYVANSLIGAGTIPAYTDLYTSTGTQNPYAAALAGVLRFRDIEATRECLLRMEEMYQRYAQARDRRGMHQVHVLALTGYNRAMGIGKLEQARLFRQWLINHLEDQPQITLHEAEMPVEQGLFAQEAEEAQPLRLAA
jgi:hypothetical protein